LPHYRRSNFGFFVFSQARVRPLTYRQPMPFETMPSSPKPKPWRKIGAAVCRDKIGPAKLV
jgi:hypothetical protein